MIGPQKIFFFILLIVAPGCFSLLSAADLIVVSGQTHRVPSVQTQTYDNVTVSGTLIVESNAVLHVNIHLSIPASGASLSLQNNSNLNLSGNLTLGTGSMMTLTQGAKMSVAGVVDVTTASINLDENSSLSISQNGIFRDGSSLVINRGSNLTIPGIGNQNSGLNFNSSTLNVDNNSRLEISNGYLDFNLGSTVILLRGSILSIHRNLYFLYTTITVTLNGLIESYGNIYSQFSSVNFDTGAEVRLKGGNQTINYIPSFYNLVLQGSGNKNLVGTGIHTVKNKLNIGSRILIIDNTLHIASTLSDAIERTSGYVIAGPLKRSVDAQSLNKNYLFPVGANGKYRPIQIKPVTVSSGGVTSSYTVEYKGTNAGLLTSKVDQVLELNNKFYHKIYREGNAPRADLSIYYDQASESPTTGNYNRIASWNTSLMKWEFSGSLGGNVSAPFLLGATARNISFNIFNNSNPGTTLYVLARAEEVPFIPNTYATLTKELDGGFYIAIQDTLRFRFEEEYAVTNAALQYKVYNKNHIPIIAFPNPTLLESTGYNRYKLNVAAIPADEFGILEVKNQKGEIWYLKFKTKEF